MSQSDRRAGEGAAPPGPFVYRHAGDLATIGRKSAVVKLGVFQLKGFFRLGVLERGPHLFFDWDT